MKNMTAFKEGSDVTFTNRKGETFTGTVQTWDYNMCTFERQYDVLLPTGVVVIGVPERALHLAV